MRVIWKDKVIAEASRDDLIYIEGNWYFPPKSLKAPIISRKSQASGVQGDGEQRTAVYLRESDTPYTCPWKGVCQYYDVGAGEDWSKDNAWSYPEPKPSAIEIVKNSSGKDFSGYVAFYKDRDIKFED